MSDYVPPQINTYLNWVKRLLRYARNGKYGIRLDRLDKIWSGEIRLSRFREPGPYRHVWRPYYLKEAQILYFTGPDFKLFRRGRSRIKCVKIDARSNLYRMYYHDHMVLDYAYYSVIDS
jgi:hypothetical protein